jgi:hypothetical protein
MANFSRAQEFKALFYRLFLVYAFYFIARALFFFYNADILKVGSAGEFFRLAYHGLTFDTAAILYINLLFILLSVLPLTVNRRPGYQKMLFWVYFIPNLLAYATNFIDFIYYKYIFARTTVAVVDSFKDEEKPGWHAASLHGKLLACTAAFYCHLYIMGVLIQKG